MKKILWGGLILLAFLPTMAFSLISNPKTFNMLDVELPFRCSPASVDEGDGIVSSVALTGMDFAVRLPGQTGVLPRYQVNHFSFSSKKVDVALAELLREAGIKVVAEKGDYPFLSARNLEGELSGVVEELTRQGNLFYTYQPQNKTVYLTHKTKAVVQIPKNKFVMMAVLDALNGGHFEPFSTDWESFQVTLTLTRSELNDVQALLNNLIQGQYILAAQVKLYEVAPLNGQHWQYVLNKMSGKISVLQNGLIGQAVILKQSTKEKDFLSALTDSFNVTLLASGKTVVPNNWKTRFNLSQCASKTPYSDLSFLLRTLVKKKNQAQTQLTLNSSDGEITSFDVFNQLDQNIALIGIPVAGSHNKELVLFLKFQFIHLIKKGEQND